MSRFLKYQPLIKVFLPKKNLTGGDCKIFGIGFFLVLIVRYCVSGLARGDIVKYWGHSIQQPKLDSTLCEKRQKMRFEILQMLGFMPTAQDDVHAVTYAKNKLTMQ